MTYPTAAVVTTNLDAAGDSPASARSDLLDAVTKLNQMIAHTSAFAATLLDDANAAAARSTLGAAASGANTDITSMSGPALGAATATTPATSDNDTSVATTAFVQGELTAQAVKLTGNQTVAGVKTFSSMPVLPTQSMVRVNAANGNGSTNTYIRRFSTIVTNQGSDITYADSATLGATFTINTTGVYGISYTDVLDTTGYFGISLNSSQLSTSINSITLADVVADAYAIATNPLNVAATIYLTAGAVIRAHSNGTAGSGTRQIFTITRIS